MNRSSSVEIRLSKLFRNVPFVGCCLVHSFPGWGCGKQGGRSVAEADRSPATPATPPVCSPSPRANTPAQRPSQIAATDDSPTAAAPPSRRRKEPPLAGPLPESLELVLADEIYVAKENLPPGLRNRLLRLAAFQNPEFFPGAGDAPADLRQAENYQLRRRSPEAFRPATRVT